LQFEVAIEIRRVVETGNKIAGKRGSGSTAGKDQLVS
jgi:hypothetical protein